VEIKRRQIQTMKAITAVSIILLSACRAPTQGTVNLDNRAGGISHVWFSYSVGANVYGNSSDDNPAGSTSYAGFTLVGANGIGGTMGAATTFAQLLGAPGSNAAESSLLPSTSLPTTFRTGVAAGNVVGTTAIFNNILPDAPVASFELAVWDNSSGLYPTWAQASSAWQSGFILAGKSAEFALQNIGGVQNGPPSIEPALQSFGFGIPEPSTVKLAGIGCLILVLSRSRPNFPKC
jgi:hypothetical protein